ILITTDQHSLYLIKELKHEYKFEVYVFHVLDEPLLDTEMPGGYLTNVEDGEAVILGGEGKACNLGGGGVDVNIGEHGKAVKGEGVDVNIGEESKVVDGEHVNLGKESVNDKPDGEDVDDNIGGEDASDFLSSDADQDIPSEDGPDIDMELRALEKKEEKKTEKKSY
ncbi:hypothetical protein EJD97_014306, partial [Solanum chilense]